MMMIMMMKLVVAETADDVGPLGTCQALVVVSRYHHQPYTDTDTVVIHTLIVCVCTGNDDDDNDDEACSCGDC